MTMAMHNIKKIRLSVSDIITAGLTPYSITDSGETGFTCTLPKIPGKTLVVSDIFISGTGTLTITRNTDEIFKIDIKEFTHLSPRMYLPLDLDEDNVFAYVSNENSKLTLMGFLV